MILIKRDKDRFNIQSGYSGYGHGYNLVASCGIEGNSHVYKDLWDGYVSFFIVFRCLIKSFSATSARVTVRLNQIQQCAPKTV